MRILLDTSAYSSFMRGHDEVKEALQSADSIAVNPIVLGELQAGFQHGRHSDKNRKQLKHRLVSKYWPWMRKQPSGMPSS